MAELPAARLHSDEADNTAGRRRRDASGDVRCTFGDEWLDHPFGFRVVRDLPHKAAAIWIVNVADGQANYRCVHDADEPFTGSHQANVEWQRAEDSWLQSTDGQEFDRVPDGLIHVG